MAATVREHSCPIRSSVTEQECLLEAGHPADSHSRFHRYPGDTKPDSMHDVTFALADFGRRTFLALSRDGSYWHFVHPVAANDLRVTGLVEGDGTARFKPLTATGALVCECPGGRMRGACYVVRAAQLAIARGAVEAAPDPSLGAGASVEAYRG